MVSGMRLSLVGAAMLAAVGCSWTGIAPQASESEPVSFAGMTPAEILTPPSADLDAVKTPQIRQIVRADVHVRDVRGRGTWRTTLDRVRLLSRTEGLNDDAVIATLKQRRDELPPPYLFELSRRLMEREADAEGVYWYALGELRTVYDGWRCADRSVAHNIAATLIDMYPVTEKARVAAIHHGELYVDAVQRIRDEGLIFGSKASPWWICSSGMQSFEAARTDRPLKRRDWLKPESAWAAARQETLNYAADRVRGTTVNVDNN